MKDKLQDTVDGLLNEVSKVVIGLDALKKLMVAAAISGGHILIEGPLGTAKTTVAKTFARALGGEFKRIQFTPDMLPTDVTGFYLYTLDGQSRFIDGPVFANVLLLDELNRTTPRTQSALLEVMQEGKVTIEGKDHVVPQPFIVIATQVELGGEGTYPLTDVQVDRFMFNAESYYPTHEDEKRIIDSIDFLEGPEVAQITDPKTILALREEVRKVHVSAEVEDYIVHLVNGVRYSNDVVGGAGPRATIALYKGARAFAYMDRREFVIPDDVKDLVLPVLKHRIHLRPESEMDGVVPKDIINKVLQEAAVPK
ncbi:MAG: MoxR family ATPase [Chloroflexi bacterium]|nr:MoxR family ATPase [Chloroflexota bacterium]MBT7079975.1 MoxR family ATPase [Chloroflexota bacterium]MBT7289495.1 MoxR family ATPase [Chloroflexota bacterium]